MNAPMNAPTGGIHAMRTLAHARSWYEDALPPEPPAPTLAGDVRADVAVLGAGLTGLNAALELAARGLRVVLVEAARAGAGGSGRSGGQVLADYACGMETLRGLLGREAAAQLWQWSLEAVARVKVHIARHAIACDWRDGCATLALKPRQERALRDWQAQAAHDYGYDGLRWLAAGELGELVASPRYCGALLDTGAGHLQPLAYTRALAQAARAAGVTLYENSPVLRIETGPRPKLVTADGTVEADQLVIAGGALPARLAPEPAAKVLPVGTYIVATGPLGADVATALLPADAALCDANFVLDYYRRSADHRLLFGGRVSYSGLDPFNTAHATRQRMLQVFPQLRDAKIESSWGGFVDITMNRAPDFGRLAPNVYYLQGFSGHGIALTGIAGRLLAEAVAGTAERFDIFSRITHREFPGGALLRRPALVLAMAWYRLKDLL